MSGKIIAFRINEILRMIPLLFMFIAAAAEPSFCAENASAAQAAGYPGREVVEIDDNSTLADYLRYAEASNPALKAAFHHWQAAVQKAPQAGALPEPRFSYSYFVREVETRVGPQSQRFGLSQALPWFGKLSLQKSAAGHQARSLEEKFNAARLELFYRIKSAFFDYYYLARSVEITRDNIKLLENVEAVSRKRYSAASGEFASVIKAQMELARLEDRLKSQLELRPVLFSRLNAALGRDPDLPLPWPARLPPVETDFDDQELSALLREHNPELKELKYLRQASRSAVELAGKNRYPDLNFGLDYIQTGRSVMAATPDDGKDPLMASFSINLPLSFGRYRAAEREAADRLAASEQVIRDRENQLLARLKMAVASLRDAERKTELYGQVLAPKAEQAVKASLQSFAAGQYDILEVIDAQRTLLEFQLAREKSLVERAKYLAEIDLLSGGTLSAGNENSSTTGDR